MTEATHAIIRDPDALSALAAEWGSLWDRCPGATPFQSPAWLLPWWRHFAPGELLVATLRHDGHLRGLAPFYVENGVLGRRVLPIGISLSDYHDVLADPAATIDVVGALGGAMASDNSWTEWELPELAPDADALRLQAVEGAERQDSACSICPVLVLPSEPSQLERSLPATKRRKLAMARNRAARRGSVEIARADAGSAAGLLDALIALHTARWSERQQAGVLADPRVVKFHHAALPLFMEAGVARLYGLRIGGRIAAVYYGFAHRDRAYAYLGGFDPDFAFESPGTVLIAAVMADAIGEGTREFHFLRGQEPYKYEWGAGDRINTRRVFRRTTP
jgi:CelD/BcsL family acetyltransferase involved in cellulose biosynthesis